MSGPREGRWLAKPDQDAERFSTIGLWLNAIWLFGLIFGLLSPWPSEPIRVGIAFATFAIYTSALLAMGLRAAGSMRRGRKDARLSDHLDGRDEYAVQIHVKRNGTLIGSDRGIVWFEDALIGFSGEKSSFLLAATDFVRPQGIVLTQVDATYRALRLTALSGRAQVWIVPLLGGHSGYRRSLHRFLSDDKPSLAERQWPPLRTWEEQEAATSFSPPPTPSPFSSRSDGQNSEALAPRKNEEGAFLRDRLEDAVAFQDEVDEAALRVGKLDQR